MYFRGRMAAYAIEEIPNLPDEVVPVIRQRERNIFGMYKYYIYTYIYVYVLHRYIHIYIFPYILIYIYMLISPGR